MSDHIWGARFVLLFAMLGLRALQVPANEDVVVNLLLSPTVDMIDASWELQNSTDDVLRYRVSWETTEGGAVSCYVNSTSSFNTSGCNPRPTLISCTSYTVTVQPQKLTGLAIMDTGTPASNSAYTLPEVPPWVTDLKVTDQLSRNLSLSWTRPATNCSIIEYTVIYEGVVLWGEESNIANTSTSIKDFTDDDTMAVTLSGLIPYSDYSITVVASTEAGAGPASNTVYAQTDEDVPTAPLNLAIKTLNVSTVHMTWDSPEEENGILTNYTVRWRLDNDTLEANASVPSDELSFDVPDLQECLLYQFSVTASTRAGEGPDASVEGSADGGLEPPVVECSESNSSVIVTWTPADSWCRTIIGYNVAMSIYVIWSGEELHSQPQAVMNATEFRDENVEPYSMYTFNVSASFEGGVVGEPGSCSLTTREAAPSEPQNLTLLGATTSSLSVQWRQPAELNGELRSYLVSWSVRDSANDKKNESVEAEEGSDVYNYTISDLSAGTTYSIEVQGVTLDAGVSAKEEFSTVSAPPKSSSVAGIVIGCIFGILLLAAIIVAFIKRDDIREKYRARKEGSSNARTSRPAEVIQDSNPLMKGIRDNIEKLESDPEKLAFAYEELNARSAAGSTSEAQSRHNVSKNRYFNILPFDRTRVRLKSNWDTDDYINASYVKDSSGTVRFIATQGPKDETVDDFWHMIWQENVRIIVMLANCSEGGKQKCAKYWPAQRNTPAVVDQKYLKLEEEYQQMGHIRRKFSLEDQTRREITQFHFTDWPDFGVPFSEAALLALVRGVRDEAAPDDVVVVHCSAGVGRTGTFISLWNLQQSYERRDMIDIDKTILKIRKDRKDMVQSQEQYLYVFKCFAEYLKSAQTRTAGGTSNRGYDDTESIRRVPSSMSENTAGNRSSSSTAFPNEYLSPKASSYNPAAPAASIHASEVASHPPRRPPLPPDSSPPPLPPSRSSYSQGFANPQKYSERNPPPLPPSRSQRPRSQLSMGDLSGEHSGVFRPPLPPRSTFRPAPVRPPPDLSNQYSNFPSSSFRDTDV